MTFTSLFTASAGLLSLFPEYITVLFLVPFRDEYQLLIQHWGFTTFILGSFLFISIKLKGWRAPVMLIITIEKVYMVILYLSLSELYVSGYHNVAIVDAIISFYFIAYFITTRTGAE